MSSCPGIHWVAVHLESDGCAVYFDSQGLPPYGLISDFITRNWNGRLDYNDRRLQGYGSASCGQYCLYYLFHKNRGIPLKKILSVFCDDTFVNDCVVADWVNDRYSLRTECHTGQSCLPLK